MEIYSDACIEKINNFLSLSSKHLVISGSIGTGKTSLAISILEKLNCNYKHINSQYKVGKVSIHNMLYDIFCNQHILNIFNGKENAVIFDEIENYNLQIDTILKDWEDHIIIFIYDKLTSETEKILEKTQTQWIQLELNRERYIEALSKKLNVSEKDVNDYYNTDIRQVKNSLSFLENHSVFKNTDIEDICKVVDKSHKELCVSQHGINCSRVYFQNYKRITNKNDWSKISGFLSDGDILENNLSWNNYHIGVYISCNLPSSFTKKDNKLEAPQIFSKISNMNGRKKIVHDLQKTISQRFRGFDNIHQIRAIRRRIILSIKDKNFKEVNKILDIYGISLQNTLRIYDSDISKKDKLDFKKLMTNFNNLGIV